MAEPTRTLSIDGQCLCGRTRYHAEGECFGILNCHCQRCRKHNGAAFVGFLTFASGRITWQSGRDELGGFKTEGTVRNFCRRCGSSMPYPVDEGSRLFNMYAGNVLDMPPPLGIWHVFVGSACPWTHVPDDEPHWQSVAPEFSDQDPRLANLERYQEPGRVTGSCLCGAVSYAARSPLEMRCCHCTRCRLSRAAAHATNLFFRTEDFAWLGGEEKIDTYKVPEAKRFAAAFCRDCGSLVPRVGADRVNVPAGGLDSDPGISPSGHIYVGSKARWHAIRDGLPQWEAGMG